MKLTFLKIFLIFLKTFQLVTSQNEYVMCYYDYLSEYLGYTCNLRIYNPNGLNNFIEINGTHMAGMTNNDVKVISEAHGSVSKNFPSIICSQFKNIQYILMAGTQIQRLDDYSFESCKNVTQINFFRSNITQLSEKTFESNENLVELQLDGNMLEELPPNIFSPLKNLGLLSMRSNNLKFISSDAFSLHQKLEALDFSYNQIYAVDEKFIDNTAVALIIMEGNLCANSLIFDDTPSRSELRAALRTCFENYENMMIGGLSSSTTTELATSPTATTEEETTSADCTTEPATTSTSCHVNALMDKRLHILIAIFVLKWFDSNKSD